MNDSHTLNLRHLAIAMLLMTPLAVPALAADKDKDAKPAILSPGPVAPTAFATVKDSGKDSGGDWTIMPSLASPNFSQCSASRASAFAIAPSDAAHNTAQVQVTFSLARTQAGPNDTPADSLQIFMTSNILPEKNDAGIMVDDKKIDWQPQGHSVMRNAGGRFDDVKKFVSAVKKEKKTDFVVDGYKSTIASDQVVEIVDKLNDCVTSKAKEQKK